jgi:glutaredoxin
LVNITLLTNQGCTPCLRVQRILKKLQTEIPDLAVEYVEFSSPTGSRLAIESGVLYPPAVFLGNRLIAKGKIDAESLTASIRSEVQ